VKEEFTFSFINTVLHASVVATPSTLTTIARLADLLLSVGTCFFGLIVNNIETVLSHCESSPGRFFTDDFNSCARVSRSSSLFAAVVEDAPGCRCDVKEKLAIIFIKAMLHASIVAASSSGSTIARLADLLFSVEAGQLGLVIHHVQVCDFDGSARVSRSSRLVTAVVKNASRR